MSMNMRNKTNSQIGHTCSMNLKKSEFGDVLACCAATGLCCLAGIASESCTAAACCTAGEAAVIGRSQLWVAAEELAAKKPACCPVSLDRRRQRGWLQKSRGVALHALTGGNGGNEVGCR